MGFERESIARAQKAYAALTPIRLNATPVADLKDRLSLLTVAGNVRRVGAIGFAESGNEGLLRMVRDLIGNCGLKSRLARPPVKLMSSQVEDFPREVLQAFDESEIKDQRRADWVLWAYMDTADLEGIRAASGDKNLVGNLLGYPQCCVRREIEMHRIGTRAFVKAIVEAVGTKPEDIRRALREGLKVELPAEAATAINDLNMFRTDERFPFLLHIACDACLDSENSPSAKINTVHEEFTDKVEPLFHRAIADVVASSLERAALLGMNTAEWRTREELTQADHRKLAELEEKQESIIQDLLMPS